MNHTFDRRLLTKYDDRLKSLFDAEQHALNWLEITVTTAVVK